MMKDYTSNLQGKQLFVFRSVLAGSSSVIAALCVHPIDTMKIRMQLQGELEKRGAFQKQHKTVFHGFKNVLQAEGVKGLYKGFTASLMRESSYSTLRLGLYEPFKVYFGGVDVTHTDLKVKVAAGSLSGLIGSALANPTDVLKVRMQASDQARESLRWHIRSVYNSWGLKGFYTGLQPTIIRAMLLNGTQLATYDHTKHFILNHGYMQEGKAAHFVSSFMAGLAVAITTSPADVVKTRVMNVNPKDPAYTGVINCVLKIIKIEGPMGFYKGVNAQWMRVGPLTMIQFMVWEQLRHYFGISAI